MPNLGNHVDAIFLPESVNTSTTLRINGGDLHLDDGKKALFGQSDDLQIYHDGTDSRVENSTGDIKLKNTGSYYFFDEDGGETLASFINDGSVNLYHSGNKKFETTSTGVTVTGTTTTTGLTVTNDALVNGINFGHGNNNVGGNILIGDGLSNVTSGNSNIAIGTDRALEFNTTGEGNIAIGGGRPLWHNTIGGGNIAIGADRALGYNTTGSGNIAIGEDRVLHLNTTGISNIAIGRDRVLENNDSGGGNIAIGGYFTLHGNTSGDDNVAIGSEALRSNTTADHNIALGNKSLYSNSTGEKNVVIGFEAGYYIGGSNNTIIGGYKGVSGDSSLSNTVIISAGTTEKLRIDSSGTALATALSTGASGTGINISTDTITGPATLTIDPAAIGDDTGLVIIKGNFQVDGTTTTINSTTMTVDDLNLTLASGAANSAAADGAGITIDGANESLTWTNSNESFKFSTRLAIGSSTNKSATLRLSKEVGGENVTTYYAFLNNGLVQPDVTGTAYYNFVQVRTDGNSGTGYTISNLEAYTASVGSGTIHADSTITNLIGFNVKNSWTSGTNNYAFRGEIPSGANRWNVYMDGTAPNYFAGKVGIGTDDPTSDLEIARNESEKIRIYKSTPASTPASNGVATLVFDFVGARSGNATEIGAIRWRNKDTDGSNTEYTASSIASFNDGAANDGNLVFNIANNGTQAEALRITSAGNVGIGTDNPSTALHISGTGVSDSRLTVTRSGSSGVVGVIGNNLLLSGLGSDGTDGGIQFYAGGVEAARILSNGNFGIGTAAPDEKLHVKGTIRLDGTSTAINNNFSRIYQNSSSTVDYGLQLRHYQGDTDDIDASITIGGNGSTREDNIVFYRSNGSGASTESMRIDENGEVGIGTNNPIAKLHVESAATTAGWQIRTDSVGLNNESGFYRDASDNYEVALRNGSGGLSYIKNDGGASTANLRFNVGGERLTILSTGNVGIGTVNPATKLEVVGDITITNGTQNNAIRTNADGQLQFLRNAAANNTPSVTIDDETGNVGIGTDNPSNKLHVIQESTDTYGTGVARFTYIDTNAASNAGSASTYFDAQFKTGHSYFKSFITGNSTDFLIVDQDNSSSRAAFAVEGAAGSNKVIYAMSNGNVGIGTNTPQGKLHVEGGNTYAYFKTNTDGGAPVNSIAGLAIGWNKISGSRHVNFVCNSDQSAINSNGGFQFSTQTNTGTFQNQVTIAGNGNVGIGTTNPAYKLEVEGDIKVGELGTLWFSDTANSIEKIVNTGGTLNLFADSDVHFYESDNNVRKFTVNVNEGQLNLGSDLGTTTAQVHFDYHATSYINGSLFGLGTTSPAANLQVEYGSGTHASTTIRIGTTNDLNIDKIYSLGWGDPASTQMGMGPYSTTRSVFGNRHGLAIHVHEDDEFSVRSSSWNKLFAVEGGTGRGYFQGNVGIGTTNPGAKLEVAGNLYVGAQGTNDTTQLQIGSAPTSARTSYLDLVADTTYSDYGLRFIRNAGANGVGQIDHRGTGDMEFRRLESGSFTWVIGSGQEKFRIDSSGNVGIGINNPSHKLHVVGDVRAQDGALILSYADAANIDHLWHDDTSEYGTAGSFVFNSDTTYKNSTAGTFSNIKVGHVYVDNGNLGTTVGNIQDLARFYANNGNATSIRIQAKRKVAGNNWNSAGYKIFCHTDSTEQGYIEFNPHTTTAGDGNYDVAIGSGSDEIIRFKDGGNVGIGTTTPQQKLHVEGNVQINGGVLTSLLTAVIADDAYLDVVMPVKGGIIAITSFSTYDTYPQPTGTGLIYYDAGTSRNASVMVDQSNTLATSTDTSTTVGTFTDGKTTIAMVNSTGTIRIWNRMDTNRQYKITLL